MAGKLPYFQWYPKDAATDEKLLLLNLEEYGLFHRCLDLAWDNAGLPEDLDDLARMLNQPKAKFLKLWERVGRCFKAESGRLKNPRQERGRADALAYSDSRKKAANGRWKPRTTDAPAMHTHSVSTAEPMRVECLSFASSFASSFAEKLSPTPSIPDTINGLTFAEFEEAWDAWGKPDRNGKAFVVRSLIGMGIKFDAAKFRAGWPVYCASVEDWRFVTITLWQWVDNGMPKPPPKARKETAREREDRERAGKYARMEAEGL